MPDTPRTATPRCRLLAAVAAATLVVGACSGGSDDASSTRAPVDEPVVAEDISPGDDAAGDTATTEPPENETVDAETSGQADDSGAPEPLGFVVDQFDVEAEAAVVEDVAARSTATPGVETLIDDGVESGAWTEIEGVRAIVSVLMGEADPALVPALDDLPHPSIGHVIERAERLLEDPDVDEEQRADLARLTAYFFDEPVVDDAADSAVPGSTQGFRRVGITRALRQGSNCSAGRDASQMQESWFGALDTSTTAAGPVTYCVIQEGDARVYFPLVYDFGDDENLGRAAAERTFEIIELARNGYPNLAGSELPPVDVLITPRVNPESRALAHMASSSGSRCRVAVFMSMEFFDQGLAFDEIIAHELFHCVQREWSGSMSTMGHFVQEGGASYFAGALLRDQSPCLPINGSNAPNIDAWTANNSLLEISYPGWLFWDYLEQQQGIAPVQIAEMHKRAKNGQDIGQVLEELVPDLGAVLNEFYVRLMGPGLACDTRGGEYTSTITVEESGPLKLSNTAWVGTRYFVVYPKGTFTAQQRGDGGPIGMAEHAKRSDASAWKTVLPEVRSRCNEPEQVAVVVADHTPGQASSPDRVVEIDRREKTNCDACPVGTWQTTEESLEAFFEEFNASGVEIDVDGGWRFTFEGTQDGTGTPISENGDVTYNFTSQGFTLPTRVQSSGSGQWTGDESNMGVLGYTSTGTASLLGVSSSSTDTSSVSVTYTCEEDDMAITVQGRTIELLRQDSEQGDPYPFTGGA